MRLICLLFLFLLFGLPIWALYDTRAIWYSSADWPLMIVVLLFQLVVLGILVNHSSSVHVRTELGNTLAELSAIEHQLGRLRTDNPEAVTQKTVDELHERFTQAKPYKIGFRHFAGFIPWYDVLYQFNRNPPPEAENSSAGSFPLPFLMEWDS